jgi:hypothetical protein
MSPLTFPFLRATEKPKAPAPKHSAEPQTVAPLPENVTAERVLEAERYTDRLFRFRITRMAIAPLNPETDRVMGSLPFNHDMQAILLRGLSRRIKRIARRLRD